MNLGCKYHPGCCIPDDDIDGAEKKRKTWNEKSEYFKSTGVLHIMRECEWKRQLKYHRSIETKLGRILSYDNETTLLKAIVDNTVFGFLQCDVTTPKHLIQEYQDANFLFPMVIQRMELSVEHLSPYMKKRYEQEKKSPDMTVVQTYNGENQFVMTPIVQLWLKRGMKVSNIKLFVQYEPGAALKPFVQKV